FVVCAYLALCGPGRAQAVFLISARKPAAVVGGQRRGSFRPKRMQARSYAAEKGAISRLGILAYGQLTSAQTRTGQVSQARSSPSELPTCGPTSIGTGRAR